MNTKQRIDLCTKFANLCLDYFHLESTQWDSPAAYEASARAGGFSAAMGIMGLYNQTNEIREQCSEGEVLTRGADRLKRAGQIGERVARMGFVPRDARIGTGKVEEEGHGKG